VKASQFSSGLGTNWVAYFEAKMVRSSPPSRRTLLKACFCSSTSSTKYTRSPSRLKRGSCPLSRINFGRSPDSPSAGIQYRPGSVP
jgi:hypothetical protein